MSVFAVRAFSGHDNDSYLVCQGLFPCAWVYCTPMNDRVKNYFHLFVLYISIALSTLIDYHYVDL